MMNRPFITIGIIFGFVLIIAGVTAFLVTLDDTPTQQPCEYCAVVLKKLPTESTPEFFDRIHVTVDDLNAQYNVYAFLPVFDTLVPVVVGAIIVYEVKK